MPLTHLLEPTRGEFSGCEPGQRQTIRRADLRVHRPIGSQQMQGIAFRRNGEPQGRLSYAASFRAEDVKPGRDGRLVWKGPRHEAKPSDFGERKARRFQMEDCVGHQR